MNTAITCMACPSPTEWPSDKVYREHLLKVHGATSSDQAMLNEKAKAQNIPKDLPPGIPQDALPTPEFLEQVKRIEEKPKTLSIPIPTLTPIIEEKPIVLEYQYKGFCPTCQFPIKTIMLHIGKRLFTVAWCSNCSKEIKHQEVRPIKEVKE